MTSEITLEQLPLADLAAWLEINPPQLPYNSLVNAPGGQGFLTGHITGASGAIAAGTGFTAARTGVGQYTITFAHAYSAAPNVQVTLVSAAQMESAVSALSASAFSVDVFNNVGTLTDSDFLFLVTAHV